jgi:integrase
MAIYQSSKGWGVDFRDEFGRRHRRHVGTQQQAANIATILSTQVAQTKASLANLHAPELKLSEGKQLYLEALPRAAKTKTDTRRAIERLILIVGDIPAAHVTPQLLQRYHSARSLELAPRTLAIECTRIKALFRYLSKNWGIPEGAASMLPTRWPKGSAGITLSFQQERQALELCSTPVTRLKFLLGIDAGLRSGELRPLRQNAVNWPDQEITVWPSKPGRPRIIPLTPRLQEALRAQLPSAPQNPEALIFNHQGKPQAKPAAFLEPQRLKGGPPFRFHDLRHTFASRLAEIGVQQHVIAALLGHTPRTSTQIYLHANPAQLRKAIADLSKFVEANLLTEEIT